MTTFQRTIYFLLGAPHTNNQIRSFPSSLSFTSTRRFLSNAFVCLQSSFIKKKNSATNQSSADDELKIKYTMNFTSFICFGSINRKANKLLYLYSFA